ncbi:diacylglycerol kinase family protein [Altererythrobacter sp. H2]|uniref:diacylglycerol/lipid kinase family protein n=1 Tax=Altererythrobacter sp. H2 TaxID=3108391 RepID=UPI002B4BF5FD|nr:diacylglycerol kinase family protein [Altererythrobacter sp. H2]WRK96809.1 diacylglycerol kinase family protein [Altererythrobacter sp. H2]
MKMDLVYNPTAGSFRPRRLDQLVEAFRAFGIDARPMATSPEGARLSGDADLVCVHGGDGTLRDTVQAMGGAVATVPLAIAPAGTINLVARELGYHRDPARLAAQIAAAWELGSKSWVYSPLHRLGEMPIVSCVSIGPDSHAVAAVSGTLKRRIGRYAYVVAMMRLMRRWPRDPLSIRGELADGTPFSCEAEAAIVSHGALYGGPFKLSARASLLSDSVELITINRSTRRSALALTGAAMLHLSVDRLGLAEIRTCRRIEFDRCVSPVQVDGDHMPGCAYAIGPSNLALAYCV